MNERWRELNPSLRHSYIDAAPALQQSHVDQGKLVQQHAQMQLDRGWEGHACCRLGPVPSSAMLVPYAKGPLPAEYVSCDHRVPVSIPRWTCTTCNQKVVCDYMRAGCFPSTPQRPSFLFSHTLLELFTVLQSQDGVSLSGSRLSRTCCLPLAPLTRIIKLFLTFLAVFANALDASHRPYSLYPADSYQSIEQPERKQMHITAEVLMEAHCNWLRTTDRVAHLANLLPGFQPTGGPFADCPCCAGSKETEDDGYKYCVCGDAVSKLSSYSGVGQATTAIQQHLNSHLDSSGLEGEVQSRYKSGRLSLNHLIGDTGGQPDDDCSASLSCSRPEVCNKSGPVSVHGLVGFCCCHGVPSLGLFCNMPTPEQFAFYLLALTAIMAYSCKVDFYIDFGCRLKITWARYVDALGHPPRWKDVRIMVNWMHGASHNQRCQVQNNGRHQPGSGWRYGEQCEQLWSMLKDMAGITRYMTLAHRADIIQSTLSKIAFRKAVGLLDLLIKTWKEMKVKLVKVQSELVTLQLVAEQAGVMDGQQASEAYRASCLPSSPAEGPHDVWKGEYVLLLLQEQAWQAMNGQAVTLLVSLTPTVTQLLWATCKGWQLKTIQSKQLTMEVTHRVDAETGISQTDMQRGLELIRLGKIAGCQFKIESLVAEVMQLQTMKDRQGTSCNETKRMAKAQARKRAQAKEELLCMAEWQALGTSQQPAALRLPETVISRMVAGTAPPWVQDSSTSGAVTLHHGKRFFQLYSDQDRIREQQSILKLELNRLKAWLRHMLEECTASQPSLSEGQQFYVAQHMAWVANEMKRAAVLNWE
ncbi:hypothetical protein QJQ45_008188 [Haematococcus lacustris]|nr:hypothetical protein QJQ45_008188 [Haematococcus lacustris]